MPTEAPQIQRVTLATLHQADVDQTSTLYAPPLRAPLPSPARIALLERHLSGVG